MKSFVPCSLVFLILSSQAMACGEFSVDKCEDAPKSEQKSAAPSTDTPRQSFIDLEHPENLLVKVSPFDLSAQTHKWDGKIIETKANCFYADVSEYRCFGSTFRVDFKKLLPDIARDKIDRKCDTLSKSLTKSCEVVIRFEYIGSEFVDVGGIFGRFNHVVAGEGRGWVVSR